MKKFYKIAGLVFVLMMMPLIVGASVCAVSPTWCQYARNADFEIFCLWGSLICFALLLYGLGRWAEMFRNRVVTVLYGVLMLVCGGWLTLRLYKSNSTLEWAASTSGVLLNVTFYYFIAAGAVIRLVRRLRRPTTDSETR